MKLDWKKISLGELQKAGKAELQTGPFGTVLKASEYTKQGVPVISVGEIRKGFLSVTEHTPRVNQEITNRLSKYVLKAGDIVFGRKGAINRNAIINDKQNGWFLGSDGIRLRLSEEINSSFVSYQLRTGAIGKWLLQNSTGSTMPSLNQKILDRLPLWLPEETTQNEIASLLSCIDAKIDLNNRINAELESLARTIYDYWFLQFDFPDEEGRPYRSSGGAMRFDEELGREVPVEWETLKISNFLETTKGNVNPIDFPEKTFKHYSLPTFDATGTYGIEKGIEIKSNKNPVKNGDLLVSKLNPWFNRVIYVAEDEDAVASTEFIIWRNQEPSTQLFLRQIATSDHFITYCTQNATGTSNSHKRVNPGVMLDYSISVESTVVDKYGNMIKPMISKITINEQENRHLASLRDWLLPLLMSGEVVVGE